jgi:hypothetical protein
MTLNPAGLWLRWRVWVVGVGAVVIGLALWSLVSAIRSNAVWKEKARVADSTAKVEQKNSARVQSEARVARALAQSLGLSVERLTHKADSVAAVAREATRDAQRAQVSRNAAIKALARSSSTLDSMTALVSKSTADDSVIAAQERALAARRVETDSLRQAVVESERARAVLTPAVDSLSTQLVRSGRVIEQLQSVVKSARPSAGRRLTPYLEALAALSAPSTYVARAGLELRLLPHVRLVGAGELTLMPDHTTTRALAGVRVTF